MPKLKPEHVSPTDAEDAAITAAALADPDAVPFTDAEWAQVKPLVHRKVASINGLTVIRCTGNLGENCELTVIPTKLQKADNLDEFEDWLLYWKPTSLATVRDEIQADAARRRERFVRANVSIQTFLAWKLKNPRFFIAERVMARLTSRVMSEPGR